MRVKSIFRRLFRERWSEKNVYATIRKGNKGYDQYTVPDTAAVEPTFVAFLSASTRKHKSMASPAILSNLFVEQ